MELFKRKPIEAYWVDVHSYVGILIYGIISGFYLVKFPFVHSDESWLSGLSRNMIEKDSLKVTETFFDLYPRNPHGIKILFHKIQMIFMSIFSYDIWTFRLISLISSLIGLCIFYLIIRKSNMKPIYSFFITLTLGLNIQFIYASHFARQEAIILLGIIINYLFLFRNIKENRLINIIMMAISTGLLIGVHPNSFVVGAMFICSLFYLVLMKDKNSFKSMFTYFIGVGIFGAIFLFISLKLDPNFFSNYMSYGKTLNVDAPTVTRAMGIIMFYKKLFTRSLGTYYLPSIKMDFILFIGLILWSTYNYLKDKSTRIHLGVVLLNIIGYNLATFLIGRYNQTSIIFLYPSMFLLLSINLKSLYSNSEKKIVYIILCLFVATTVNSYMNLKDINYNNYYDYIKRVSSSIPHNKKVLANLNTEYGFNNNQLYDYRNLNHLKENNMVFKEYIISREIEYIVYSNEMDYIMRNRPKFNTLYGDISFYYEDMKSFLENKCILIDEFEDSTYGIRINKYIDEGIWTIKIYRVKDHYKYR
ncbi:ArnT family glycosyltransferase [Anaeromicrobium sediminis]|uniref:Glycosyltransferase RgtA/B/C/D-like domain-containing protein n=1 Tax=Anaeromicrobium sediminis TaxID=1478221 RepID=A0A267MMJ4_9FIRM|nr:glycosyltransferase family 39 protein [Anaeromicrobium sediminis]PAB60033.1 hypothetical protein CCE28_06565 [Anaeromicrobium sediminis]